MKPLVSILIPCHNAADWVEQAVESALAQTWPKVEVIVIDDGSNDGSPEKLRRFGERIRLVERENRGGNPTRNELMALSGGAWLQFLDADDALLPDKIERQMAVVEAHPGADVIYAPIIIEDRTLGGAERRESRPHKAGGPHDPWTYHLHWALTQTGGALFRRAALERVGGWNERQKCCQDNELFFRLLKAGCRFEHCDHAGALYRRFPGTSVSTRGSSRVREEILRLLEEGERWLREQGELTPERKAAADNYRFGLARQLWPKDAPAAEAIMEGLRREDGRFRPAAGPHAPLLYRVFYRLCGFRGAERISLWRRRLQSRSA